MKTPISMGPCNQHMLVTCKAIDFALLRDKSSNFGKPSSDEVREETDQCDDRHVEMAGLAIQPCMRSSHPFGYEEISRARLVGPARANQRSGYPPLRWAHTGNMWLRRSAITSR
jgi:hypothetical protein